MPEVSGKPTDVFRVLINASIHDVWKEITRTDAPIACFFNNRIHLGRAGLQPGSTIAMRSASGRFTGVVGEILEVVPPTRFSHTFKFTNMDDPPCVVTYELRDVGGQTEFTLIISAVLAGSRTHKQMMQGGSLIVNTLKSVMETGRPSFGTRMLFMLFRLLEPVSPARSRSERWPVN